MNKITNQLYLGSNYDSEKKQILKTNGIKGIVMAAKYLKKRYINEFDYHEI